MDRLAAILENYKPRCVSVLPHRLNGEKLPLTTTAPANIRLCLVQLGSVNWKTHSESIELHPGDLLWLSAQGEGYFHSPTHSAELVVCELACGPHQENPALERMPAYILVPENQHDASLSLAPVMNLMLQEASNPECGQNHAQSRLAEVLMIRVLRYFMRNAVLNVGIVGALGDIRLARAITAIHEAPGEQWSVERLAKQAGMSRTAFSNTFHKVVGSTPMSYLTHWRMRLACIWLRERHLSVGEIADRLGYRSETAFRRAFRNTLGQAPGALREVSG